MLTAPFAIAEPAPRRALPVGEIASLAGHALLLLAALLVVPARRIEAPAPPSIAVDLLSPERFAALFAPPAPVPAPPSDTAPPALAAPDGTEPATAVTPAQPAAAAPIRATRFFAAGILADPANRRVAEALPTLGNDERVIQLCNIEGLEQIRAADGRLAPDTLVPYAMAEMSIAGGVLVAKGGAFRSRRRWFGVSLSCAVAADFSHVEAFEFTLGAAIPREQWEAHNLNAADADE